MIFLNDDSSEMIREYYKNEPLQVNYDNYEEVLKAINDNFIWDKQQKEKNESLLDESPRQDYCINFRQKINSGTIFLIEKDENRKTRPTTLTNSIKVLEKKLSDFSYPINNSKTMIFKPLKLLNKKRGRKNYNIELKKGKEHDKFSEDNIMKKIKTHLMDHIVNSLNESLKDKTYEFYKIDSQIAENLKKDFNLKLMENSIGDIFMNNKLSNKYRKKKKTYSNSFLINKIYEEKVEIKTIEILKMKYIDIINEIKKNCLNEFLKKIEEKEQEKLNSNVQEYIVSLEKLFLDYENWFKSKKGRVRRKGQKV